MGKFLPLRCLVISFSIAVASADVHAQRYQELTYRQLIHNKMSSTCRNISGAAYCQCVKRTFQEIKVQAQRDIASDPDRTEEIDEAFKALADTYWSCFR